MLNDVLEVLDRTLFLGGRSRHFSRDTPLLGSVPELDSHAVVLVITGLEERFGIEMQDDEVSADSFRTVGDLVDLVKGKLANTTP